MADLLADDAIRERLAALPEWSRAGNEIVRDYKLKDFMGALAFVNAAGLRAEELDHHPDILIHGWNKVRITLSTHSAGGLTDLDFRLAALIEELPRGGDA